MRLFRFENRYLKLFIFHQTIQDVFDNRKVVFVHRLSLLNFQVPFLIQENYYNCCYYYYYVLIINFLIFSFVYFIQKSISVQNAKRFIFNVKVYFRGTVECIFDLCNLPSNFQKHSRIVVHTYKYIFLQLKKRICIFFLNGIYRQ